MAGILEGKQGLNSGMKKRLKDFNKLNELSAELMNRNPDEFMKKPFNEWCGLVQLALEKQEALKPKK